MLDLIKKYLVPACATLLAVVAFFLLFGKCVGMGDASWNGFQVIFGASNENTKVLTFSFLPFLAFLLLIAGIALVWLNMVPFNHFISAGLLLVAAILFFCFPTCVSLTPDGEKLLNAVNGIGGLFGADEVKFTAKACLIISGILNILAAGVIGAKDYLNALVNKYVK